MAESASEAPVERLMESMRSWGGAFTEFSRLFGLRAGMHVTDAEALVQIINAEDKGAPLTQSVLSRRIGLTSGATSSLLNRLEEAGHIERRRDRSDRRVVTLRSTAEVHRRVDEFFAEVGAELAASMAGHPPEELERFADLVAGLTGVMERHLSALR